MTWAELAEHSGYLADEVKLEAYRQALSGLVEPGRSVVLDLGAGTGILGLLAAEAGARRVYAVDSGSIIGPAQDVARASPFGDAIVHLHRRSAELALPEPVDLAVCDQIGGFVHDAGVLEYFADARRRLLAPDGRLVPARFHLYLAPVECAPIRRQLDVWASSPGGFDLSPFRELAVNAEHRVDGGQVRPLGPGTRVATVAADHPGPIQGSGPCEIDRRGRCDGLVGWFEADLGAGVTMTNSPRAERRIDRWCNVYPIADATDVGPDDSLRAAIDVRPRIPAVTWRFELEPSGTAKGISARYSTALGQFLAPDEIARAKGHAIESTPVGSALAEAISLADGTRSTDEVIERATASLPRGLQTDLIAGHLRKLLLRFTSPVDDPARPDPPVAPREPG